LLNSIETFFLLRRYCPSYLIEFLMLLSY